MYLLLCVKHHMDYYGLIFANENWIWVSIMPTREQKKKSITFFLKENAFTYDQTLFRLKRQSYLLPFWCACKYYIIHSYSASGHFLLLLFSGESSQFPQTIWLLHLIPIDSCDVQFSSDYQEFPQNVIKFHILYKLSSSPENHWLQRNNQKQSTF